MQQYNQSLPSMMESIILNTDSYKASHWVQYPPNTQHIMSYIESRGGKYDELVFFGLQAYIKKYLMTPINLEMIEFAEKFWKAHGEPFNKEGWMYILQHYDGKLPLQIKAVKEGMVVKNRNVLVTIENTDPKCYWLTSYVETSLLRGVWYPTTVATNSWNIKQTLITYMKQSSDVVDVNYMLHDFGGRGVSSLESAGIAGAAHLVNFYGSDNVAGVFWGQTFYDTDEMLAYSVPAGEHSSYTSWTRPKEAEAYRNMLEQFKDFPVIALVSDSYDIYNAIQNIYGGELKDMIMEMDSTIVIRPDSSPDHPKFVVLKVLRLLEDAFGCTINSKEYKVLNKVRVLQGDGIDGESVKEILSFIVSAGYSAENMVFGSGGALLQKVNRDTCKFAMKACWGLIDGEEVDIFKDPITDPGKRSKKGRVDLFKNQYDEFYTDIEDPNKQSYLETVFLNGELLRNQSFEEIRNLANT